MLLQESAMTYHADLVYDILNQVKNALRDPTTNQQLNPTIEQYSQEDFDDQVKTLIKDGYLEGKEHTSPILISKMTYKGKQLAEILDLLDQHQKLDELMEASPFENADELTNQMKVIVSN